MTELRYGDDNSGSDVVRRAADRRIRQAALDLLNSLDLEDDDARVGGATGPRTVSLNSPVVKPH